MKVINRMLRLREVAKCLFVFCIFSFCVNGINAQSVVIDNLLYEVVNLTEASVKANSKDITSANILEKVEIEGVEYAVTSIKDHAFSSCKNLTLVYLPNGVISIGYSAFAGCSSLESIVLPETLVNLGNEVFWQCTSLTSITIPDGITSIGDLAFYYCESLQSVSFSDNLTSIGEDAFGSCTSLTSIEFPEKLNYIGGYAFGSCESLQYITVNSPTPPELGENPFGYPSYETLVLTVPKGSLSAYQSAEIWKKFGFIREKGVEITDGLIIEKDGIYYRVLSAEEKTLETTFAGETYDEVLDEYKGDVVIPNVVNYENVEFTVVAIGESTFARCKNLKSVFLPNGIKSIRASAFSNCSSLSDIQLPEELTTIENQAFLSCTSLSNISLPISLTTIGSHAFLDCPSLTSIEIPSKVTVINFQTFEGCTSLNHVVLPKDILTIDNRAFAGCSSLSCITIKNTVPPTVYEQTFSTFDTTELIVPVGTKSAYQSAEIWKNFKTIREEGEEEIADGSRFEKNGVFYKVLSADAKTVEVTFKGETYSEFTDEYTGSVVIPQTVVYEDEIYSVVEIGEYAFHNCPSLKSVSLPKNLSHIRKRAFYGCSSLSSVSLSSNLNTIGERAFYSCSSLASINLPNSVTFIDERAFYECSSLASVVLPTGLTELSAWTFGLCTNLKSVTLNEKLNTIGDRAFSGCESIAKLILPESIETIGSYAFYNCKSLSSLTLEGSVPPAANDNSFDTYETTVLTVPFGSKSTYQTADVWKNFSNIREDSEIVDGYKFEVGGIFYKIISASDKTVEVTFKGESFNEYADEYKGEVVIPAVVSYSNINFSVTAIGVSAFNGCAGVTSVEIPESVTSIKLLAFIYCSGLVSVVLNSSTPPNALASSFNTYETTVLTVPAGAKSAYLASSVWKNFSNIREDSEIVDGYKFEVGGIFYKIISASDKTVEVTFKGESFNEYADEYKGEVVIPAAVSYSNISFSVTAIGVSAFNGCAGVTSVEIPESVTSIKLLAFNDCSGLVSVVLNSSTPPNALASSFNTYETTVLTVPTGAKSAYLASSVWKNFSSIREDSEIVDGYKFEVGGIFYKIISASDKTVEVTFKGESFNEYADEYKGEVVIPAAVSYRNINFSVTAIGVSAFNGCAGVTSVEIPESVTSIKLLAFNDCSGLVSVVLNSSTPPNALASSFNTYETTVLTVPAGAKSAYLASSVWKNFNSIKEEGAVEITDGFRFEKDDIYYRVLSAEAKTVEVTYSGEAYNEYKNEYSGDVVVPQTVNYDYTDFVVTGVRDHAFDGCDNLRKLSLPSTIKTVGNSVLSSETLRELYWNSTASLSKSVFIDADAPTNMVVFIPAETSCDYKGNVVRNGVAEEIVLTDALPLRITKGFKAKKISYTRHFDKETVPHKPGGWESIILPFDVQSFVSEEDGDIAPFNSGNSGAKPFMLAQMTASGFAVSSAMKANVPYIIAMPNSSVYDDEENISGNVTFIAQSANGVEVKPTVDAVKAVGKEFDLVPAYEGANRDFAVYALNDEAYKELLPGSAFVSGLREIRPFEAYASVESKPANAKTHFVIGDDGTATDIQRLYDSLFGSLKVECHNGVLYIFSSGVQTIGLYSSDGRLVRLMELEAGKNAVTGLPEGVYFVGNKKVVVK